MNKNICGFVFCTLEVMLPCWYWLTTKCLMRRTVKVIGVGRVEMWYFTYLHNKAVRSVFTISESAAPCLQYGSLMHQNWIDAIIPGLLHFKPPPTFKNLLVWHSICQRKRKLCHIKKDETFLSISKPLRVECWITVCNTLCKHIFLHCQISEHWLNLLFSLWKTDKS